MGQQVGWPAGPCRGCGARRRRRAAARCRITWEVGTLNHTQDIVQFFGTLFR